MLARRFLVLSAVLLVAPPAFASHSQQGTKLVGTGAVAGQFGSHQGVAVAVSADGNTAVVGGNADNNQVGATWVFTRSAGVWNQQGTKLIGTGGSFASQGTSVAVSADGNTAVVGGFGGGVWAFTRTAGVWTQQGPMLVGTGAVGNAQQGASIALSADGNTAVVGGVGDNSSAGAAWVFTRSGTVWSQQGPKLVGTGAVGSFARQGWSVAVSADGNTAVVGGISDNNSKGAAWVYTRSSGVWSQQGAKLVGTGAVGSATQGYAVSLSTDGNTAVVGGPSDNGNAGATWVFTRSVGVWSQQGTKLVVTGGVGLPFQGSAVALSTDGNIAVVGGSSDNNSAGATWVFTRSGVVWTQYGDKLLGTGAVGGAGQGGSVAVSADGTTIVVGGQQDNSQVGAAWVFVATGPVGVPPGPGPGIAAMSLISLANPTRAPIRFALSAAADQSAPARVHIYDVSGRMIKSMEIGRVMQGVTSLTWDGNDDGGKPVASGTYVIRLEATGRPYGSVKATILR